jgi:alpha-beta hydrolase superfamily lysophospholipase
MSQRHEGHLQGANQNDLFFQTWTPPRVRGSILITHGLAEHSECYHPLAKSLNDDGWKVYAWDMRGHGRSEGKRGFVMGIESFMEDLGCLIRKIQKDLDADGNWVLFGHSLGALVTARFVQENSSNHSALTLSAPCFGLSVAVPKLKRKLAEVAFKWMPSITMHNEIKYSDLTHDESMRQAYAKDPLRHDKISPGLFLSMVENFPIVIEKAPAITGPVLLQLAGDDRVVDTAVSREFFERLPGKKNQTIVYPESYHEVFNDMDRDQATLDLKKFINPLLGA